jgi:hypothetical protein
MMGRTCFKPRKTPTTFTSSTQRRWASGYNRPPPDPGPNPDARCSPKRRAREGFAFGWRRSGGRTAIPCRKSETKLSLAHEQSILFACRIVGPPFRLLFCDDKSARKNRLSKISRNPLISLDSNERIQGNPRESNSEKPWFPSQLVGSPRKPKPGRRRARVRHRVGKEPDRLHRNAQRFRAGGP